MAEGFNENAKGTVTQYKVYENQTDLGTDYGVTLMLEDGRDYVHIPMKMGDNATQVALDSVGQAGGKNNALTIAMLLDEAAGGRCDACRTTVEGLARIITNLVRDATLEQVAAMKAGPAQFAAEKAKLELKI